MRWQEGRKSQNVEDLRNQKRSAVETGARAGLIGAGLLLLRRGGGKWMLLLAILLIIVGYLGFDSFREVGNRFMQNTGLQKQQTFRLAHDAQQRKEFVSAVLAETEDVWTTIFQKKGKVYKEPGLVLYHGAIRSACGTATTAIGPFYCPDDSKIYLDEGFFDQLSKDFGAPGEFASAYVIAHEVGHHVQNLDGTLAKVDSEREHDDEKTSNILTERLELQADCYAGIWANYMKKKNIAEGNDIAMALNAAHKIGDDNLQKAAQGYIVPDSFTHGTSAQRSHWFAQGLKTGNPAACNTITGRI